MLSKYRVPGGDVIDGCRGDQSYVDATPVGTVSFPDLCFTAWVAIHRSRMRSKKSSVCQRVQAKIVTVASKPGKMIMAMRCVWQSKTDMKRDRIPYINYVGGEPEFNGLRNRTVCRPNIVSHILGLGHIVKTTVV